MRFLHDGMELWYGTSDTPAPVGDLPESISPTVTVAVRPIDAGNSIRVVYRVSGGSEQFVDAKWVRNDTNIKSQYFTARFPQFRVGDIVHYYPICWCAGRKSPTDDDITSFTSSFTVVAADRRSTASRHGASAFSTGSSSPQSTDSSDITDKAGRASGNSDSVLTGPQSPPATGNMDLRSVPPAMGTLDSSLNNMNIGRSQVLGAGKKNPEDRLATISGFVRTETGGPIIRITVRAFYRYLRHYQFLGEAVVDESTGYYQIVYTEGSFRSADKKKAGLIVRAFDNRDNLLAESPVLFNVSDTATINLILGPITNVKLTEYENLVTELEPALDGADLASLSDSDIEFLVDDTGLPAERIGFLRAGAGLAAETSVPTEVFYGWARRNLPLAPDKLLSEPADRLRAELITAIRERIIPDISGRLDEILGRLVALRIQRGLLVRREFTFQLLDKNSAEPLAGYNGTAVDMDATPKAEDLGSFLTDGIGIATISYFTPKPTLQPNRRMELMIVNSNEQEICVKVTTIAEQSSPQELRIEFPELPDSSAEMSELALPASLVTRLRQNRIETVADLRRAGGVHRLAGLDPEDPKVKRLEAHVRLSTISSDANLNTTLIEKGFDSPLKIASASRSEFVRAAAAALGDFKAAQLHAGARAQVRFLNNAVTQFRVGQVSGQASPPGFLPDLDRAIDDQANCHCDDCEAAVSPAAYLTDLLDYTVSHVKLRTKNNTPPPSFEFRAVNLQWLEDQLHQHFSKLPASCDAVGKRVRQIRICCEVLRNLIKSAQPTGSIGSLAESPPSGASLGSEYRRYLENAYQTLLGQIGTSYEELRDTLSSKVDDKHKALADRIGILPVHLDILFANLEPGGAKQPLSEPWLEEHFGFISTLRDPLIEGETPLLVSWRLEYLRRLWQDSDFPGDAYNDHALPLIDPDLIGPDDFRKPRTGEAAFDLWQQRRALVDSRVARLTDTLSTRGMVPLLIQVYGQPAPDLIALRSRITQGDASELSNTSVAKLDLTTEGLIRLAEVSEKSTFGTILENEEISDTVNILMRVEKQRLLSDWIREEQEREIELDPRIFWLSLHEPAEGEWPPARISGVPRIDPEILERKDLPEPTAGRMALALWDARSQQLEDDLDAIKEARETDGTERMLRTALGHPASGNPLQHDLDRLRADLVSTDEAIVAAVREAVSIDLQLTVDEFALLMTVLTKASSNDSVGQPKADEWNKTYALLNGAHKRKHLYPQWLTEENQLELDAYWKILKARLPRWRTSSEARQAWQQALQTRSQAPIIDPDLLGPEDIIKTQGALLPPFSLWKERKQWVSTQLQRLRDLREQAATPRAGLDAMLTDEATLAMPVLGLGSADLRSLANQRERGEAITLRLRQLLLENNAFNYLERIIGKIESNIEVIDSEWFAVDSMLIQIAKRQLFAEWRREEQIAQLYLGPDFFHLPPISLAQIQPAPPIWRGTAQSRRVWNNTLQSRAEQVQSTINALQEAVSKAEETALSILRDALVNASGAPGNTVNAKAKWITDHLMIDAAADGCHITTRIGQAIESLQNMLWSIRTGQLTDSHPDWILDADNFDEEWKWIGSYATWRAAMFVFLYPENIAIPSLRKFQTPAFIQLVETVRNQRLTPETACQAANEYASYFNDVCHLTLDASCRARVRIYRGDDCHKTASAGYRNVLFLFARSQTSKKVYWSSHDFNSPTGFDQSFWDGVPGLAGISKILGAVPFARLIFLFLDTRRLGERKLLFTRYDLESGLWDEEPTEIELPEEVRTFDTVVVAQRWGSVGSRTRKPPALFLQYGSQFYSRRLEEGISQPQAQSTEDDQASGSDLWRNLGNPFSLDFQEAPTLLAVIEFSHGYLITTRFGKPTDINHVIWLDINFSRQGVLNFGNGMFQGMFVWAQGESNNLWYVFSNRSMSPFNLYLFEITDNLHFSFINSQISVKFLEGNGRLAIHCEEEDPGSPKFISIAYEQSQHRLFVSTIARTDGNILVEKSRIAIAPQVRLGSFDIPGRLKETERYVRWLQIRDTFINHKNLPESVITYLREAYYFVPMHLALQLQQAGHYTAALDWFRTVYDYSLPPDQRKIYYGLEAEESFKTGFERVNDWLLDPLNPHAIASTRANSYTRFTLLFIIRCLLDYADEEFTRDTPESVPRARTLYLTALDLLGSRELKQNPNKCAELIGSVKIEVGEPWKKAISAVLVEMNSLDLNQLATVIGVIKQFESDTRIDDEEKVFRINSAISDAKKRKPKPKTIATIMDTAADGINKAYAAMLSSPLVFDAATTSKKKAQENFLENVANVTNLSTFTLENDTDQPPPLPWLREPTALAVGELEERLNVPSMNSTPFLGFVAAATMPGAVLDDISVDQEFIPAPSFSFCIPPNPVVNTLRMRADLNLRKLRQCRNIAGIVREIEPYAAPTDTVSGLPLIGAGGQLLLPGAFLLKPTQYRYKLLIERTKELVHLAAQIEAAMLASLEKRDAEAYQVLKARQELQMAQAGVRLQNLRVTEANDGVQLATLQRDSAQSQVDSYQEWLDAGLLESENTILSAYADVRDLKLEVARQAMLTKIAETAVTAATADYSAAAALSLLAQFSTVVSIALSPEKDLIRAESTAQIALIQSGFERRVQEWIFKKSLAEQDVIIGNQQIVLANDHVDIVEQEQDIAVLQTEHAQETVDFLINKFTNVELYDWMSRMLEGVYSFFLQRATAAAKVAENQLSFERQEVTPACIKSDYWDIPDLSSPSAVANSTAPDRHGLTGSARLLQDIYQLDQYAFETDRRKLQLTKAISLAQMAPIEFQHFRETGVIVFATPMQLFDRDFPGHYLRLIKQVRTSVIALIPPIQGIKATLSTTGTSHVVIGPDVFQTVLVNRGPDTVALSAPLNATGLFELNPQAEMLLPFEGIGVDTMWEFRMPKAANAFDYRTIADVLITIDYTALNSFDYRAQVIQQLDPSVSTDIAFIFRQQFADPWYDLNNPDQTATPMTVRFETNREDYPPNIADIRIQHVVLHFVRKAGVSFEVPVTYLRFTEQLGTGTVGGSATSIDGTISTRRGNAASWTPMIGKTPVGVWELALPNTDEMRNRFRDEDIEDILFVLTCAGMTPNWPT